MVRKLTTATCGHSDGGALVMALVFGAVLTIVALGALRMASLIGEAHNHYMERTKARWTSEGACMVGARYVALALGQQQVPGSGTLEMTGMPRLNGLTAGKVQLHDRGSDDPVRPRQFSWDLSASVDVASTGFSGRTVYVGLSALTPAAFLLCAGWGGAEASNRLVPRLHLDTLSYEGNVHANGPLRIPVPGTGLQVTGRSSSGTFHVPWCNPAYPRERCDYRCGLDLVDEASGLPVAAAPGPDVRWLQARIGDYSLTGTLSCPGMLPEVLAASDRHPLHLQKPLASDYSPTVDLRLVGASMNVYWHPLSGESPVLVKQIALSSLEDSVVCYDDTLRVRGVLDGRLTLVTTGTAPIVITGALSYADCRVSTDPGGFSDDALALVSGGDMLLDSSPSAGSDPIVLFGAFAAPRGAFRYYRHPGALPACTVELYGGIMAAEFGPLTWGTPGGAHFTRMRGDERFMDNCVLPPGMDVMVEKDREDPTRVAGYLLRGSSNFTVTR